MSDPLLLSFCIFSQDRIRGPVLALGPDQGHGHAQDLLNEDHTADLVQDLLLLEESLTQGRDLEAVLAPVHHTEAEIEDSPGKYLKDI